MEKSEYIQLFEKFLAHRATKVETQTLIDWLKEQGSFNDWLDIGWNESDAEMNPNLQQQLYAEIQKRVGINETKKWSRIQPLLKWAAILLLPFLSVVSVYFFMSNSDVVPQDMIVTVEKGQKATVTLPDGSCVWVNSDSRLTYGNRFNTKERILELDGEAYFEVHPDTSRPFIVKTSAFSVKALGTSFDIKSYANEIDKSTVLMTGEVEVRSHTDVCVLAPNQKVTYNKLTGAFEKTEISDAMVYANWKNNQLSFDAETFENIVATLNRLYNTEIVFESESLKHYRFTGTPGNTSLESILQILSLTSPLVYEVQDSVIVLRENTKEKAYYEQALK